MPDAEQRTRCCAGSRGVVGPQDRAASRLELHRPAATRAAVRGVCWNGSPYQPVPVAVDVAQPWRCGCSSSPRTSRPCWPSSRACAPTRGPSASTSRTCSATSARSPSDELRRVAAGRRPIRQRRLGGRPRRRREAVRRAGCAGCPATAAVAVDSMGRVPGAADEVAAQAGDTLVTSIDAKVQSVVEQQLAETIATARATLRPGDRPQLRRRLRRGRGHGGQDRPDRVAMASQPTYDPEVWVGGISQRQLRRALLREGRHAAARPRDPGPVRARAPRGSRS